MGKQGAAQDYISLPLETGDDADSKDAVREFNDQFDAKDIQIAQSKTGWIAKLRQVDIPQLESVVQSLFRTHPTCEFLPTLHRQIRDIGSYGLSGQKRLYVGYNRERKVKNRVEKEKNRGKHYYANGNDFLDENVAIDESLLDSIVCDDSENYLSSLPSNSVDLVFTSPPYNFGQDYGQGSDADRWNDYFKKLFRILDECVRILKYGGRLVVNLQPLFSDYIPTHHIVSNYLMSRKLIWKGEILWDKNNYNCKYTAWGSWKSPASPYLKYTWEYVEVFCKGSLRMSGSSENADIDADSFKNWVTARWNIAPEKKMHEYAHPAMFPEELAHRVLLLFSFRGCVIVDPFAGTGTTAVMAKKLGRRYIGVDISAEYCEMAENRLQSVLL